jgi:hypothetical protein
MLCHYYFCHLHHATNQLSEPHPVHIRIHPTPCFCWCHPFQIECVTRLAAAAAADPLQPDPVNYLLQHSAGSGKSLTIAALVLALTQLVSS